MTRKPAKIAPFTIPAHYKRVVAYVYMKGLSEVVMMDLIFQLSAQYKNFSVNLFAYYWEKLLQFERVKASLLE